MLWFLRTGTRCAGRNTPAPVLRYVDGMRTIRDQRVLPIAIRLEPHMSNERVVYALSSLSKFGLLVESPYRYCQGALMICTENRGATGSVPIVD